LFKSKLDFDRKSSRYFYRNKFHKKLIPTIAEPIKMIHSTTWTSKKFEYLNSYRRNEKMINTENEYLIRQVPYQ